MTSEKVVNAFFRVNSENTAIEVDEGDGNQFHLGPILRKYTSAKLSVKPGRRITIVELPLLWDAYGLLRALQYDLAEFNRGFSDVQTLTASELKYACYRLTRQASALGVRIPRAGKGKVEIPGLDQLIAYIEELNRETIEAAKVLLSGGIVDFNSLFEMFKPGTELLDRGAATGFFGIPTGMRVRACYYARGKSLFGVVSTFYAALEFVVSVGGKLAVVETHFPTSEFNGTRSVTDGFENFIVLDPATKAELVKRGELYIKMNVESGKFLEYVPGTFLPVSSNTKGNRPAARARGGGRIMIDAHAAWVRGVHSARSEGAAADTVKGVLKLVAQRSSRGLAIGGDPAGSGQAAATEEETSLELLLLNSPLPDPLLFCTWPCVAGFSFQAKSWGVVMVSGLREVRFASNAFERLVIPKARKQLIEALVMSHSLKNTATRDDMRTDVIAGKGEGTIFLLHGPPGVGKTLTAEAIAEVLERPLYVVSMGELGTTPETLEERLMDIFELCVPWGALVLIDEAEMLLERRAKNEVVRNAMVCVMLRLIEYYTGILFLTTNRIESLDPAFQSRVQCALCYDNLDVSAREQIWRNTLARIDNVGTDIDIKKLAEQPLNGRQIKNVSQLAVALSRHEGAALMQRHLDTTLGVTASFLEDLTKSRDF